MEKLGILKILVIAAVFAMFIMLFDTVMSIFFVTILASLMAIFFVGTADRIDSHLPGGKKLWISVLIFLILGSFALVIWISSDSVASQVQELGPNITPAIMEVNSWLSQYGWGQDILDGAGDLDLSEFAPALDGIARALFESLTFFFVALVAGLFLTYEPGRYRDGLLFFSADKKRTGRVIDRLQERLYRWTIGRLASMAVIFVLTWIGLAVLGVPLAFLIALIAGLLSFIPNFGPIVSAVLAAGVALSVSPSLALWTVVLFIGVQVLESNVISPLIERKSVYLPPGVILLTQAFMGLAFGILGLIVATPIVVGVATILSEYKINA